MLKTLVVIGDDGILTRQALEIAKLNGCTEVELLETVPPSAAHIFVAVSDTQKRVELIKNVASERLVNLIHPSAVVSPTASLDKNILVGANAIIGANAQVAQGVVQNALSSIEHDNHIGPFAFLGTGAILCGNVTVAEFAFVGGGVTVKPGVSIGANTIIGTGAVLVRDAMENSTYVGNPAKKTH